MAIVRDLSLEPLVLLGIGAAAGWDVAGMRYQAQARLAELFAGLSDPVRLYVSTRLVESGISRIFVVSALEAMRSDSPVPLPDLPAVSASGKRDPGSRAGTVLVVGAAAVLLALALK